MLIWVFIQFRWSNGKWEYLTSNDLPGSIQLDDDDGQLVDLKRIEPTVGVKSLGVISTATVNEEKQLERMHGFIKAWTAALNVGKLPPHMNLQAMNTRIIRTLLYPLPATSLTQQECINIESALYRESLPKCDMSSKLPLAVRYCSTRYMGLGLTRFEIMQGLYHLGEFIENYHSESLMAQQIIIQCELIQTILGTQTWCFDYSASIYSHLIDKCWIKTLWEFVSTNLITIQAPHPAINLPRQNDVFLMEAFVEYGCNELTLRRLNNCRMCLQVITLSDIVDAAGRKVLKSYLEGHSQRDRLSKHKWPKQPRPCQRDWKLWSRTISTIFLHRDGNRLLNTLGTWQSRSHQEWRWYYDVVHKTLYNKCGQNYIRYI